MIRYQNTSSVLTLHAFIIPTNYLCLILYYSYFSQSLKYFYIHIKFIYTSPYGCLHFLSWSEFALNNFWVVPRSFYIHFTFFIAFHFAFTMKTSSSTSILPCHLFTLGSPKVTVQICGLRVGLGRPLGPRTREVRNEWQLSLERPNGPSYRILFTEHMGLQLEVDKCGTWERNGKNKLDKC